MIPGGQTPTGVVGAGKQARLRCLGRAADYCRCHGVEALPKQAVQLRKDGNGFLIAGGPPHSSAHAEFILPFVIL